MKYFLLIILLFISVFIYGQHRIEGIVTESDGKTPIDLVTVYLNGTTKGTYTNNKGYFTIQDATFPCLLVVSCIGYETQSLEISESDTSFFSFKLKEMQIPISEIVVAGKNQRKKNIEIFKTYFLGNDKYGREATIKNDDVLRFAPSPDFSFSKEKRITKLTGSLNITTTSPLIIEFPSLGYLISIDLINFSIFKEKGFSIKSNYIGYYYFKDLSENNPNKKLKYKKEREKIYYNSSIHFLRSLYNNALSQNGFVITKKNYNKDYKDIIFNPHESPLKKNEEGYLIIENLKDLSFWIYYCKKGGKPINLEEIIKKESNKKSSEKILMRYISKSQSEDSSKIFFLSDTCYIVPNGITPDDNIMFGGYIAKNKIGSMLPEDYDPIEKEK